MLRVLLLAALALLVTPLAGVAAVPDTSQEPVDGSNGGGDPYFPLDGNGGYQVRHYDINATMATGDGTLRGGPRCPRPPASRPCAASASTSS